MGSTNNITVEATWDTTGATTSLRDTRVEDLLNLRIIGADLDHDADSAGGGWLRLVLSDGRVVLFGPDVASRAEHGLPDGDPIVVSKTGDESPKKRLDNYEWAHKRHGLEPDPHDPEGIKLRLAELDRIEAERIDGYPNAEAATKAIEALNSPTK